MKWFYHRERKTTRTAKNYFDFITSLDEYSQQIITSNTIGDLHHTMMECSNYYHTSILDLYPDLSGRTKTEVQRLSSAGLLRVPQVQVQEYMNLVDTFQSIVDTSNFVNNLLSQTTELRTESADVGAMSTGAATTQTSSETFTDMGGEEIKDLTSGMLAPTTIGASEQISMSEFLSRPVSIFKVGWTIGTNLTLRLAVWDLFTSNPAVRSKIRNFAYLRGNLNIRVSLSGTPFHYSHVLVSPQPFANLNTTLQQYGLGISTHASLRAPLINYLSQATGSAVMDVRDNRPLDFVIPYMATKPVMRLFNNSSTVMSGSFTDAIDMCDLYIYSINPLGATTATSTNVYLQVYAWMDSVELGTSTGTQMTIVTESLEMKQGPVQRTASRFTSAFNSLAEIPILKPYATAASMVSSGIAKVASLFGWSRPVVAENSSSFRNFPVTNSTQTIGNSHARRITIDPLQEVDVSCDALGINQDELVIRNISSRPSYLTSFTWQESDVPLTPIYTFRVHPNLVTVTSIDAVTHIQPTAMAFAVQPFEYWRGDITFRLDIVCSAFHRGKFAVFYEPNCKQYALINANINLNKQFLQVIDIQETQSVEFTVNWASYREWLKNMPANNAVNNTSILNPAAYIEGYVNGYVGIVPFTELQSQSSTDPVYINVYVYSKNLEVNGFTDINTPAYRAAYVESAHFTNSGNVLPLNLSSASHAHINERYFGESIQSFRSLLKRYVLSQRLAPDTLTIPERGGTLTQTSIMPPIHIAYGATPEDPSYTYRYLFDYLRYAFIGYKGGIRYIVTSDTPSMANSPDLSSALVGLADPSSSNTALNTVAQDGYSLWRVGSNGQSIEFWKTNSGIEFELPFYSNNLFAFSFNDTNDDFYGAASMERTWFRNLRIALPSPAGDVKTSIYMYIATGEDFSFVRFQGAPYYTAV